jgi:hypothetical protein
MPARNEPLPVCGHLSREPLLLTSSVNRAPEPFFSWNRVRSRTQYQTLPCRASIQAAPPAVSYALSPELIVKFFSRKRLQRWRIFQDRLQHVGDRLVVVAVELLGISQVPEADAD